MPIIRTTRQLAALAALALAGFAAMAPAPAQAQWAQSGYDLGKSNANTIETTLGRRNARQLTVRWSQSLELVYVSAATQAEARVFTCGTVSGLSALSAATGELLWQQPRTQPGHCTVPALSGGRVLVGNSDDDAVPAMSAYDQATGQWLWTTRLTPSRDDLFGLDTGPATDGERVYAGVPYTRMAALNPGDGSVAWETLIDPDWTQATGPSAGLGRVFVAGSSYANRPIVSLVALDAATGAIAWKASLRHDTVWERPVVLGSRVYVVTGSGRLLAFDGATGTLLAQLALDASGGFTELTAQGNRLFVTTGQTTIYAIDVENKKVAWSRNVGVGRKVESRNLAWANGLLYMITEEALHKNHKRLLVLRSSDGSTVATLPFADENFGAPELSIADGRVLVTSHGVVRAYGL